MNIVLKEIAITSDGNKSYPTKKTIYIYIYVYICGQWCRYEKIANRVVVTITLCICNWWGRGARDTFRIKKMIGCKFIYLNSKDCILQLESRDLSKECLYFIRSASRPVNVCRLFGMYQV
jgi:hypothetical protein